MPSPSGSTSLLPQRLGIVGATATGLGAILGTGVFVTLPVVAQQIGFHIIWVILLAGTVAACNALSSAQLAAAIPVSGGTYEYGYRLVHPIVGFIAGWMFLCAKTASAAAAAMASALYLQSMFPQLNTFSAISIAMTITLCLTIITWFGLRFSLFISLGALSIALLSLIAFSIFGFLYSPEKTIIKTSYSTPNSWYDLFYATALIFVAYTGYGRIATLGEEVLVPRITIPRAILTTLVISAVIYFSVAGATLSYLHSGNVAILNNNSDAPLVTLASIQDIPLLTLLLAVGALAAMVCVELNLILGISRVLLAMARREDMPPLLNRISQSRETPQNAVLVTGLIICTFIKLGDMSTNWAFSALTVLIYYSITNLCLLKLPKEDRLFPAWLAALGCVACASLAAFIPYEIWYLGITVAIVGLIWRILMQYLFDQDPTFS